MGAPPPPGLETPGQSCKDSDWGENLGEIFHVKVVKCRLYLVFSAICATLSKFFSSPFCFNGAGRPGRRSTLVFITPLPNSLKTEAKCVPHLHITSAFGFALPDPESLPKSTTELKEVIQFVLLASVINRICRRIS